MKVGNYMADINFSKINLLIKEGYIMNTKYALPSILKLLSKYPNLFKNFGSIVVLDSISYTKVQQLSTNKMIVEVNGINYIEYSTSNTKGTPKKINLDKAKFLSAVSNDYDYIKGNFYFIDAVGRGVLEYGNINFATNEDGLKELLEDSKTVSKLSITHKDLQALLAPLKKINKRMYDDNPLIFGVNYETNRFKVFGIRTSDYNLHINIQQATGYIEQYYNRQISFTELEKQIYKLINQK